MATYMIGYDLKPSEGETYDNLWAAIKKIGSWRHDVDSTWFVISSLNAAQIRDELTPHMYKDDKLVVVRCGPGWATYNFPKEANEFFRQNL